MDFKQLQSFAAVVKYQSFTKAAEMLYISQPTISTHIRALEEELQSRLVLRTTKDVEITPRGWELYQCAEKIFLLRDSLVESWQMEMEHVINLGASTIPSAYILPEVLPGFLKANPGIQIHIHQGDSREIISQVLEGNIKLGMVGMKVSDENLTFLPFYRDTMVLITPATEYYRKWKDVGGASMEKLLAEPFLLREQGSGSRKCMENYFLQTGIREQELHVVARLNDQEAVKRLVSCGLGVSIISAKAAEKDCQEGKLLSFPLPGLGAARNLYLVWRNQFILSEQITRFMGYVQDVYAKEEKIDKINAQML